MTDKKGADFSVLLFHLSSRASVRCAARDLGEPRDAWRFMSRAKKSRVWLASLIDAPNKKGAASGPRLEFVSLFSE
jgi:hypothetical protein